MMSAKYFEYYTIILRGGAFFRGHTVILLKVEVTVVGDKLQAFRVDAQTAHKISMDEIQVAVGAASPLQNFQS